MDTWQDPSFHGLTSADRNGISRNSAPEALSHLTAPGYAADKLKAWLPRQRDQYGGLGVILLVTFLLYLFSLPKEFTNWDDPEYILNNPLIRSLSLTNLNRILTEPYFANYAPVTLLSYALDYRFFGLKAAGYHIHNVLLHLACIVTLYFLLLKLGISKRVVLLSALLFAVHPVNVESVSWTSERKNLLATFFFLLSFYQYIRYREIGSRSSLFGFPPLLSAFDSF